MQTDVTLLANNTQQCWELLALVASVCMGLYLVLGSTWSVALCSRALIEQQSQYTVELSSTTDKNAKSLGSKNYLKTHLLKYTFFTYIYFKL